MTAPEIQAWAQVAIAVTGPPSVAWALSKLWMWNGMNL